MPFVRKWVNPSGTREYFAWRSMRARCRDEKCHAWKNYGGRGIWVCDAWADDYDAFFADMGACPDGMSIDRIDVNGGYEPGNCRWATELVQGNNRRTNVSITYLGETLNLSQWASRQGIDATTLWRRLNVYNMPIDRALTPDSLVHAKKWEHGTRQGYESGCKCLECKASHAERHRRNRAKRRAAQ